MDFAYFPSITNSTDNIKVEKNLLGYYITAIAIFLMANLALCLYVQKLYNSKREKTVRLKGQVVPKQFMLQMTENRQ